MNSGGLSTETQAEEEQNPTQAVVKLVRSFGYPIEVMANIETEDKYLLTVYRIPHGLTLKQNENQNRPVVLIMHGLISSSVDYLLMGPKRGLAFILAEAGYDVWMGNFRGNSHSFKHKHLDPLVDKEYWNFSFHEIGIYDLPAMIDLVKEIAGCEKLSYIASSQGTTSMFVLLSEKPQYIQMIKIFICLAPMHCIQVEPGSLIHYMSVHPITWKPFLRMLNCFSFPSTFVVKVMKYVAKNFCHREGIVRYIVIRFMFIIFGANHKQLDKAQLPAIINNVAEGTSYKHYTHFSQNAIAGKFRQFDYGAEENLNLYRQETPPNYDFNKVTCPVALYYSAGDLISGLKAANVLKKKLPNIVVDYQVEDPNFNHLDFSYALDVVNLLYKHVQKTLDKFSK